ncbi:hypothetical protein JCM11641_007956 [Rhodosporidiobolus odoratus]
MNFVLKCAPDKATKEILRTLDLPKQPKVRRHLLGEDALAAAKVKAKEWVTDLEQNEVVAESVNVDE